MEKVQEIFAQLDDVIATQNEVIAKIRNDFSAAIIDSYGKIQQSAYAEIKKARKALEKENYIDMPDIWDEAHAKYIAINDKALKINRAYEEELKKELEMILQ